MTRHTIQTMGAFWTGSLQFCQLASLNIVLTWPT